VNVIPYIYIKVKAIIFDEKHKIASEKTRENKRKQEKTRESEI
jgi:hypothetical protein